MSIELPDKLTPLTKVDLIEALWMGHLAYFGAPPSKECLWIVAAQVILETGLKYCHNYNLGNVKSKDGDGFDYQFFGCGEEVSLATANAWKAKDPSLVKIKRIYQVNGKDRASVWVDPPHWVSRFRAFHTAEEGALDHVALLARRFPYALEAAKRKDIRGYAHALKQAGYYTADEGQYTATIVGSYVIAEKVPVDYDALPVLTDAQGEQLMNLVARSIQASVDDYLQECREDEPDTV